MELARKPNRYLSPFFCVSHVSSSARLTSKKYIHISIYTILYEIEKKKKDMNNSLASLLVSTSCRRGCVFEWMLRIGSLCALVCSNSPSFIGSPSSWLTWIWMSTDRHCSALQQSPPKGQKTNFFNKTRIFFFFFFFVVVYLLRLRCTE